MTEERLLPDDDDEQPIVPMRDLSAEENPDALPEPVLQEPPRLRMVGGILLLFAALGLVVALIMPLYTVNVTAGLGAQELGSGFVVTLWGATLPNDSGLPDTVLQLHQVINLIIGDTPMWGIPLVFVALLLAAAGGIALWRPTARYASGAALGATALLVACFAMLGVFLNAAFDPARIGGAVALAIGASFWLLVFAVLLAVAGLAAVLLSRPLASAPQVAQAEREEPETPPMGFPAPVVLPDLDEK
ncbi:MAG TPA: hypothetical protein VGM75_11515 [Pseudonocardiaceae bacterium]